jgi:hypothetical protein
MLEQHFDFDNNVTFCYLFQKTPDVDEEGFSIRPDDPMESILLCRTIEMCVVRWQRT